MDTILKLHSENLKQLKAAVKHFGAAVIHGDGNIYPHQEAWTPDSGKMNHSYNNATFSNPNREEATYFKVYKSVDAVPATIEDLQKELIAERFSQSAKNRAQAPTQADNVIPAWKDEPKGKSNESKLQDLKDKVDAAAAKASEAKVKADAEGASDKDKKDYEKLQAKADEAQKAYDAAL